MEAAEQEQSIENDGSRGKTKICQKVRFLMCNWLILLMKRGRGKVLREGAVFLFWVILAAALVMAAPSFHTSGTTSNATEDQTPVFSYNFSANVTNSGGETLIFEIVNLSVSPSLGIGSIAEYTWIALSSSTGVMTINATRNNQTGFFNISVFVHNAGGEGQSSLFYFNVSAVNDRPYFMDLENLTFNMTEVFSRVLHVYDEENNIPFAFNISFVNCTSAEWWNSTTNGCRLFNSSYYSANGTAGEINITFIPGKYNVGSYTINFTIADAGSPNASSSQIVNWTVLDVNSAPAITGVCNYSVNGGVIYLNATENQTFGCYINATDIGENRNISFNFSSLSSFSSDFGWFANQTTRATNLSVNYSAYIFINATPSVRNVGNWTINLSVTDTGAPLGLFYLSNSTTFIIYVSNLNHSVALGALQNLTLSNSSGATAVSIYINATDDDILIPDKSVYNESLVFSATVDGGNASWVNVYNYQTISGTNITTARVEINPASHESKNYTINISANDANNYSRTSKTFVLELKGNHAPAWGVLETNRTSWEGNSTFINLSASVSDADGDNITFSYSSDTAFSSFSVNSTTGIINFTSDDADVGQHIVAITATDALLEATSLVFNFTIYNINDSVAIAKPLSAANVDKNATINTGTNTITATEDRIATINIQATDNDLKIPSGQKWFYNESINLSVSGLGTNLINFTLLGASGNLSIFSATFIPAAGDTGTYNITLTATDRSGLADTLAFNLTIQLLNDAPALENPSDDNYVYAVGENFYLDFNATDEEDFNESTGLLAYQIRNLSSAGFIKINITTGVINITFNQSHAGGPWRFNVSVNDSGNMSASWEFNLNVYDYPLFIYPSAGYNFSASENSISSFNFSVNHSVRNNLVYALYVNNALKNRNSSYGNGTVFFLNASFNYTDENCLLSFNLTLNASNAKVSNISTWSINITHTNQPITLYRNISEQVGGSTIRVELDDYFEDADASDSCYNQKVTFSVTPLSASPLISYAVSSNWQNGSAPYVTFSYSSSITENFIVTANEYNSSNSSQLLRSVQSNNFSVRIIISESPATTTSSSGGGGGSVEVVYLRIIVPGPVSANKGDTITLPIQLSNPSRISLSGIKLNASAAKDGVIKKDFGVTLDKNYLSALYAGGSQNLTLTAKINTKEEGLFEINIYADASSPAYSDSAKIYVNVGAAINEKLVFTEKFIVENPECLELKEMVDDARRAYESGNYALAQEKMLNATEACRKSISQKSYSFSGKNLVRTETFSYVAISSLVAFILGIIYYYYGRIRLTRAKGIGE